MVLDVTKQAATAGKISASGRNPGQRGGIALILGDLAQHQVSVQARCLAARRVPAPNRVPVI